jgi:hypothetical protein
MRIVSDRKWATTPCIHDVNGCRISCAKEQAALRVEYALPM